MTITSPNAKCDVQFYNSFGTRVQQQTTAFIIIISIIINIIFLFRHVINVFLLIYQLGTCCVYVVFVSSNIKSVADAYTGQVTDIRFFMLMILLPLILINWVMYLF